MPLSALATGAILGGGQTILNTLGGLFGANRQAIAYRRAAADQHKYNMELMKYQLDYNTPKNQMARYKEAGLNPNLVYNQGNPGNMQSAPSYPDIKVPDYQAVTSGLGSQLADLSVKAGQAKLLSTQADLNKVKTDESAVKQDLMRAQRDLTKANPYMRPEYVNAMVMQLESTAKLKYTEASFYTDWTTENGVRWQRGYLKMQRELDLLAQKLNLNNADLKVKAEIIQSKEFQNALQEIQVKWMKDGDITSQHIYTGIMLMLSKLMR